MVPASLATKVHNKGPSSLRRQLRVSSRLVTPSAAVPSPAKGHLELNLDSSFHLRSPEPTRQSVYHLFGSPELRDRVHALQHLRPRPAAVPRSQGGHGKRGPCEAAREKPAHSQQGNCTGDRDPGRK
ncbi:unnamed protein product [Rangifer tarandus platyrhynchus]|uniref:Uncharacterized protein n=1 Tax=Rangifer tarandus platyrhynchus TaxID=3082113 RepID=A0AC59YBH4_RANTA